MSMRDELDGNVEALKLLPEAEESERIARKSFSQACAALSEARNKVACDLSRSVTNILPALGLEGSSFHVQLSERPGGLSDPYHGSENVGVDVVDFLLLHQKNNNVTNGSRSLSEDRVVLHQGGSIEQVGSSGEKSRVLLAIETALPGSIGASCDLLSDGAESVPVESGMTTSPISIIYDEIDAHVGGRAAVTMAKLLSDQSRGSRSMGGNGSVSDRGTSQIIAITHSASIAAIADRHSVVDRYFPHGSQSSSVRAYVVDGSSRRKEIARMASGDLASDEAETFADALIRDALLQRSMSTS
jgi:DNA repair ATPase RecN